MMAGRKALIIALLGLVAMAGGSTLQAQGQTESLDPLNLPDDIVMLGERNPNVRSATAVVNGYVITGTDIDHRVALVLDANRGLEVSPEEIDRLRMQVLRNLIDETLQIQQAGVEELAVSQQEVEAAYADVSNQNGFDVDEMDDYLARIGSSPRSLKRQIEGELDWQRVVGRLAMFVNVSQEEVEERVRRMREAQGTEEYRVAEIYLSANTTNEQSVFENANRIMGQLREGGNFQAYARQFSEASTASVGGDLGWVSLGILPSEMDNALQQMQPGQLVGPLQIPGGFTIMLLVDKRQVLTADPRDAVLSLKQMTITFEGLDVPAAEARLLDFTNRVQQMRGCGDVEPVAALMGADVISNDQISARDLPGPLQETLLQMQVGQSTPPFGSMEEGVRMLMLCGREDPVVDNGPTVDEMRNIIENERIDRRAQRYLRDLQRDAIIEYN
jgi:peptidyl-prolyl cis-trans isomerase SurA